MDSLRCGVGRHVTSRRRNVQLSVWIVKEVCCPLKPSLAPEAGKMVIAVPAH